MDKISRTGKQASQLLVTTDLNFKERMSDAKAAIFIFAVFLILGAIFGYCWSSSHTNLLNILTNGFSYFLACFLGGVVLGLALVLGIDKLNGLLKRKDHLISAAEKRIFSGSSTNIEDDLHSLVDGHLQRKRIDLADHYSKVLLDFSTNGAQGTDIDTAGLLSTSCYVSTSEYPKKIKYKLGWLFESKGTLSLSKNILTYKSKKISFVLNLSDITEIEISRHPLWQKPLPLTYIVIEFQSGFDKKKLFLTPHDNPLTNTVWHTNRNVKEWLAIIQQQMEKQEDNKTTDRHQAA